MMHPILSRAGAFCSLGLVLSLAACQTRPSPQASLHAATSTRASGDHASAAPGDKTGGGNGALATISPSDLRDVLAELDKGHHDKMKLAFIVQTPLKPCAPPFRPFYHDMGVRQKALANELESWAKAHHIDLTYHFGTDTFGKAQELIEDMTEKRVRSENQADFDRDMIVNERQDYEWNISLLKAFQPEVRDPALKAYVEKSLHTHEEGLLAIENLLRKYKFEG